MNGKFYFVATPIGNLNDFSTRQIETLNEVDIILCEDTRNSLKLLNNFHIQKQLLSFHKFNYSKMLPIVEKHLKDGKNLALITDAGMPCVSDPGSELIEMLKTNEIDYTVVSGVSAFLNAFVLSGFSSPFTFIGFLPEKLKDKNSLLTEICSYSSTLIFYSSVHNIDDDLLYLYNKLGDRKILIARELTKLHEEKTFSTLKNGFKGVKKGEFVIVVEGKAIVDKENLSIDEAYEYYINLGYTKNEAIKLVAKERNVNKNEIYKYIIRREKNDGIV